MGERKMLQAFAVMLPIIVLLCGLSIDVGMLELKEAQMQTAADAAALSAELEAEKGTGNWVTLGQQDAAVNGFTNGSNNTTVSVTQFANFGAYNGRYDGLQVTITQPVKTIFMGALNGGYTTASASSVALITPCVYLTGTTLQQYPLDGASGDFKSASCPFNVNNSVYTNYLSLAPEALNIAGSASASSINGYEWPTPNYNAPTVTDPLSSIASPSYSGTCNHTNFQLYALSTPQTVSPGTYCGGLNIISCGGGVTLSPGLYVITGGANWYNSKITGTGVTLYFTSGGGSSYGKFDISGNSVVTLSAPTTSSGGSIAGILVFTDRSWVHTNPQDVDLISSSFTGDGIWYLPGTGWYIQNAGTVTGYHYFGIVADNLTFSGSSIRPLNDYEYVTGGNPFRRQGALVQ
jgi:Flp pilus assembly protein TadG